MRKWKTSGWALMGAMVLAVAAGCPDGGSGSDGTGGSDLSGQVKIDGSSTVYPISEAAATKFGKDFPSVRVTVGVSGTGGGFKKFTKGDTDISDASRPIKQGELDACISSGVEFIELPVAYDGLSIVVNPKNSFVEQLTVDELKKIFRDDGAANTWQDVNPEWPAEEIKIFAPGTDSGTFDYFKEVVLGKDEDAAIRADMSVSEDDSVLVTGVAGDEYSIGFFGAAYYFTNKDKLKAVKIVNPDTGDTGAAAPEATESGGYAPLRRPLFIYVTVKSLDRLEVEEFVTFYLDAAADLAKEVHYVALPETIYDQARTNLIQRNTGTHFLTETGESRSGSLSETFKPENLAGGTGDEDEG